VNSALALTGRDGKACNHNPTFSISHMLSSVSCLALAGIMERFVKEVGPMKVAAVVTDNATNAVKLRRLLKRITRHIIIFR
jgi:hypothetical protein